MPWARRRPSGRDLDGEGVPNTTNNAPNPTQADLDHDGLCDVCDPNVDGDHVPNCEDRCPSTQLGAPVDNRGCSIPQICPCAGPRGSNRPWRNHCQYVDRVQDAAKDFVRARIITQQAARQIVDEARSSTCGGSQ